MDDVKAIWRARQPTRGHAVPSLTFALQSLLAHHEAYMASAERDRLELTARIERLERENTELERRNKETTDENHALRDEVDQLNDAIKEAESKISMLEATLIESQREVRRLEATAERAETLERQIAVLEEEQTVLRTTLARTEEDARSTLYRWRQAEKGLNELQAQLERMEKEAKEERERHAEVKRAMERQLAMEKQLNAAAGRLKGAAAVKSMSDNRNNTVVSHFVRDLLQDNANLQLGIAELREMLRCSNDEIQALREQLMYHQPVDQVPENTAATTLQAELAKVPTSPPPRVSKEVHIHHHIHVAHKSETRKPRRRRLGHATSLLGSDTSPSMPSSARFQRAILGGSTLTSVNDSPVSASWWSLPAEDLDVFSSAPSSPRTNRDSIFDKVPEISSPASPTTSVDPTSPKWKRAHSKRVSEFSLQSISEAIMSPATPARPSSGYRPRSRALSQLSPHQQASTLVSAYTTDDVPSTSQSIYSHYESTTDGGADGPLSPSSSRADLTEDESPRALRRIPSRESIMSLSNGLDIHTLQARPSQLSLRPLGASAAGTDLSNIIARATLLGGNAGGKRGSVILRDSIAQHALKSAQEGSSSDRVRTSQPSSYRAPSAFGKFVSWRPWGGSNNGNNAQSSSEAARKASSSTPDTSPSSTPVVTAAATTALAVAIPSLSLSTSPNSSADAAASLSSGSTPTVATALSKSPRGSGSVASASIAAASTTASSSRSASLGTTPVSFRAPGVNQPGPVPGFAEYWLSTKRKGSSRRVEVQDAEAVGEAVREGFEG
jgi:cell division protein FtsB